MAQILLQSVSTLMFIHSITNRILGRLVITRISHWEGLYLHTYHLIQKVHLSIGMVRREEWGVFLNPADTVRTDNTQVILISCPALLKAKISQPPLFGLPTTFLFFPPQQPESTYLEKKKKKRFHDVNEKLLKLTK